MYILVVLTFIFLIAWIDTSFPLLEYRKYLSGLVFLIGIILYIKFPPKKVNKNEKLKNFSIYENENINKKNDIDLILDTKIEFNKEYKKSRNIFKAVLVSSVAFLLPIVIAFYLD